MAGYGLVALVFAREVSDPLIGLVKDIDKQLETATPFQRRNREKPGVFVVFCSDDPGLQPRLQALVAKEGIKHVVFSISRDKSAGPKRYRVAREAELTAVVYAEQDRVIANYVLDSIDLTAERRGEIVGSIKKVLR